MRGGAVVERVPPFAGQGRVWRYRGRTASRHRRVDSGGRRGVRSMRLGASDGRDDSHIGVLVACRRM
jgi:hypothetical protein